MTLQKADVPPRHDGTNLQGGVQHSERAFPTIPSKDGDHLANAQRWLLVEERMKVLCKDLGYAMPERLTLSSPLPKTTCPGLPCSLSRWVLKVQMRIYLKARLHKRTRVQRQAQAPSPSNRREMEDVKPKLATSTHSTKYLRQMLGGMDDCMVTRIHHGNNLYSEFVIDDPLTQEEIILSP